MQLTDRRWLHDSQPMDWQIRSGSDPALEDRLTEQLVDYNREASAAIRVRFEPDNLASRPVEAYAVDARGTLVGGCTGRTEDVWQWLTIDTMWVSPADRGSGVGRRLLEVVEQEARGRGCRWAKLNTWDFQAPGFYEHCGYREYGREEDYPPGHVNHLMRKDL
jgi:GNAT superfamily N-acetyltransferase